MPFSPIPEAIEDFRAGRMLVVVDDEDRENEGDLTIAADKITPDAINFMARFGRGLICLPMTAERLEALRKLADVFGIVKSFDVFAGTGNGDAVEQLEEVEVQRT